MPTISTPNGIWLWVVVLLVGALAIWWLRKRSKEQATEAKATREKQEQVERARRAEQARAGTHDAHGHRLCIICNDGHTRATKRGFQLVQAEGLPDLVRRKFGAPARYTVKEAKKEDSAEVYCDACAVTMRLGHEHKLLKYESDMREAKYHAAIELHRWFNGGCNDVAARHVREHDAEIRAEEPQEERADVVELPTSRPGI